MNEATSITVNDARLHFRDRGVGPALVLLHGGLGAGSEWDAIAAAMADRHRVVTFDSRGHGHSTNPAGTLSYSQLAADTAALIDALDLRAPTVAGWSDGGQVALELAVRHPDAAGALVVGGAYPEFERSGLHAAHMELAEEIRRGADADDAELADLRALHADWPALVEQTTRMWTTYLGIDATAIAVPTLVLAADRDELVGLDLALALYRLLPDAELAVLPGARHETPFAPDRAPLLSAMISDFAHRHPTERTT